ncbi:MAG: caspase family protein, partial [Acidobacteria bacterium]|nr:caspase family protein [Acidobacteriota bacterium]
GPDDQLFIFIAGHGYYKDALPEGFLIFKDGSALDKSDEACLDCQKWLRYADLRNIIDNIGCRHIFVVIDACFGGTFGGEKRRGDDPMYEDITNMKLIERKMPFKTRLYLTSGGKVYVPDGVSGHHSPFARRFIEALRSYGGNAGLLTLNGILSHVERTDPTPTNGEFKSNEPGSDFFFIVKSKHE